MSHDCGDSVNQRVLKNDKTAIPLRMCKKCSLLQPSRTPAVKRLEPRPPGSNPDSLTSHRAATASLREYKGQLSSEDELPQGSLGLMV